MAGGSEDACNRGGHEGVHGEETCEEHSEAKHSESGSAQVGGEKEDEELARGFGSEAVDESDDEDGFCVDRVVDGVVGDWVVGSIPGSIPRLTDAVEAVAEEGVTAFRKIVGLEDQGAEDVNAEDEEGEADEALGPAIDADGEIDSEEDDDEAEGGNHDGVAEGVDHAETHGGAARLLDADDVGDGGDVVVVEAVAEAEQGSGEECEIERVVHGGFGTAL